MVALDLVVDNGKVLVWNVDDLLKLRQEHRIVGQLLGSVANISYQEKQHGLPLSLLKEEVTLLVDKGFARLVQIPAISNRPNKDAVDRFKEHREQNYHKQVAMYKESREKQLRSMLDRIIEGKEKKRRQKLLSKLSRTSTPKPSKKVKLEDHRVLVLVHPIKKNNHKSFDPAAYLQKEVDKIKPFPPENAEVTSYVVSPFIDAVPMADPPWEYPSTEDEYLHYQVFRDLWEKGFYITPGHNFGGDFLVYPGDPILFHSHYIVRCIGYSDQISVVDLIAFGRISGTVRKRAVFASLKSVDDEEVVVYQSLDWPKKYEHSGTNVPFFVKSALLNKS